MPAARGGRDYFLAHGLGNDYLVFEAGRDWPLVPPAIRAVCDRWRGLGADGIVVLLEREPAEGVFGLRMFNPDGSEFERSGNGLRVAAAYLHGEGLVASGSAFRVRSGGSEIRMTVHGRSPHGVLDVSVEMGRARTGAGAVELDPGLGLELTHPERGPVPVHPVSVGNPHAVIFTDDLSDVTLEALGPFVATHPGFARGTNVQLARVEGAGRLRIAIWERGVGRTSASGTSSCAVAVAAVAERRIAAGEVEVEMEGGVLRVGVTPDLDVTLRGPVEPIARGRLEEGFAAALG